ncbi:DJ-1/PfpI family protein [Candidatus Woesearchaeota archaeon]|nr:DJ-1/PfpI family protein [Candidatus Woesearchaeota archaeon]
MDLSGKVILFVIAPNNFRDEELLEPRKILENYKAKTVVASNILGTASGMLGAKVTINLIINKIDVNDYDAIVFVGGQGSTIYWNDKTALNIAKESYLKGKIVASICLGSGTLANSGIFKNKNATGWPDTKELIEKNGGKYTGNDVEVSGRIVSASGPKAAKQFGELIAKALSHIVNDE